MSDADPHVTVAPTGRECDLLVRKYRLIPRLPMLLVLPLSIYRRERKTSITLDGVTFRWDSQELLVTTEANRE